MNNRTENPRRTFVFRLLSFVFSICAICVICGSLPACSKSEDPNTLYIVSPHASDIRLEFSKAFSAWHKQKYGTEVTVKWPDHGGTSDIARYLDQQYQQRKDTCGYDLFFGGGSVTFNTEMSRGHLAQPPNVDDILKNLPEETKLVAFKGIYTETDPETKKITKSEPQWFAATMSNFGIAINKLRIKELKLKTPRQWKDLAEPEWFGQLSLADPSKSGSVLTAYEMILDQYGWEEGWKTISLMFANADAVKDGGSNPAEETDLGNTAAGVVIDFFARNHVAKLGNEIMGFVIPQGGAQLDADPVAMLKGAPHAQLAGRFIEFCTSPEGQKLWVYKPKTPGGPQFKSLGRLAIDRKFYTDPALTPHLFDPSDPFAASVTIVTVPAVKGPRRSFLGDLMKTSFVDNHTQLVAARRAINKLRATNPDRAAELDARLGALPTIDGTPLTSDMFAKFKDRYIPKEKENVEKTQTAIKVYWSKAAQTRYETITKQAGS